MEGLLFSLESATLLRAQHQFFAKTITLVCDFSHLLAETESTLFVEGRLEGWDLKEELEGRLEGEFEGGLEGP